MKFFNRDIVNRVFAVLIVSSLFLMTAHPIVHAAGTSSWLPDTIHDHQSNQDGPHGQHEECPECILTFSTAGLQTATHLLSFLSSSEDSIQRKNRHLRDTTTGFGFSLRAPPLIFI